MTRKIIFSLSIFILILLSATAILSQRFQQVEPAQVGMSAARLEQVTPVIQAAIASQDIPGAVLLVARHGKVVLRRAYGDAQLVPEKVLMSPAAIFDMASVTKPVATATSVMVLLEQGKLRLQDKVKNFVPGFNRFRFPNGEFAEDASIVHLLTHTSGLPPYFSADSLKRVYGYPCPIDSMAAFIGRLAKSNAPGEEFHYSCLNFITLAKIVKDVSGLNIHQFSQKYVFAPLRMEHTGYIPQVGEMTPDPNSPLIKLANDLIAPTEVINGIPLHGTVHDPLARLLGGISGNAGLFSNVDDLFVYAQMLLNGGKYGGVRVLSPLTVQKMTMLYPVTKTAGRALGWDVSSDYSSNGGDLFPTPGFGHTGYTGTSIWVNPATATIVILLTNRVHPADDGSVTRLRGLVANIVAAAIVEK